LRADLLTLFEAAKKDGHYGSIASISRELRGVLELTSRITGELTAHANKANVVNVALDAAYLELRGRLLNALRKFPEAYAAVIAEFRVTETLAEQAMAPTPPLIEAQHVEVA